MELTHGRLKAALIAGKIPVTDEALAILRAGLSTIGRGYHIDKVISGMAKTDTELKKELSRLHVACRTVVDVLDADLSGLSQIGAMLSDPWRGSQVPRLVEELRLLSPQIEMALAMAAQEGTLKKRRQNPETWFFLAVHDLYSEITVDHEPGVAGPLHRFTKHCAALIDAGIVVPESENSFQKRLTAAIVFPGK